MISNRMRKLRRMPAAKMTPFNALGELWDAPPPKRERHWACPSGRALCVAQVGAPYEAPGQGLRPFGSRSLTPPTSVVDDEIALRPRSVPDARGHPPTGASLRALRVASRSRRFPAARKASSLQAIFRFEAGRLSACPL